MSCNCQKNSLNDFWGDLWDRLGGGVKQAGSSIDQTRKSLDQTTATIDKVMKEVDTMIVWLKPAAIIAGTLVTTLIIQEIYLNAKEMKIIK